MSGNEKERQPVMRLRSMFIGLCVLATSIAIPLSLVWKQSYINQASIRLEYRADTLARLDREMTALSLEHGKLSAAPRIERIARTRGFEYPLASQLEVLDVSHVRQKNDGVVGKFFAGIFQRFERENR